MYRCIHVHAWCVLYLVVISDPFMFSGIHPLTDTRVHLLLNRCGLSFEVQEIYYTFTIVYDAIYFQYKGLGDRGTILENSRYLTVVYKHREELFYFNSRDVLLHSFLRRVAINLSLYGVFLLL